MSRLGLRAALVGMCGLLANAGACADDNAAEARVWLERMSQALASSNYDGLFTHSTAQQSETMRIVHRVEDGQSVERLVSLDGNGREIIRTAGEVHCFLPDRRKVLVRPRNDEGSLAGALPAATPELEAFYSVSIDAGHRLLERDVRLVEIRPRDKYRYGYRLWLDEKTAMPLRSIVCDAAGRQIEQIKFSKLSFGNRIPAREVEPGVDTRDYQWVRDGQPGAPRLPEAQAWHARRVPPGFRLVGRTMQAMPGTSVPAQHLIFSDGMAAVSVFIETRSGGARPEPTATTIGSSSAFSTQVGTHMVTAVGEVPPSTVRYIATSVAPASDGGMGNPTPATPAFTPKALAPTGP